MIYRNGVWSYRGVIYGSLREALASAKEQNDQRKQQQSGASAEAEEQEAS